MGVVYEVSADGRQGKIVYDGYIYTTWGKEQDGIPEDLNSGRANMKAVYEVNGGSFDGYPPFQWAHGLNPSGTEYTDDAKGIWYLPAWSELEIMLKQWKPEIISSLQTINRLPYPEEEAYFGSSSSQSNLGYAAWLYRSPLSSATSHKTQFRSNFFAVMEF